MNNSPTGSADTIATTHTSGEAQMRMDWFDTFLNPIGLSSPLQFTRAWTVLFFTQFFVFFGIGIMLFGVAGLAGADIGSLQTGFIYIQAIIFVLTTLCSFIIHMRRLNDAGRFAGWALIALLPLIVAMAAFIQSIHGKSAAYNKLYEDRAVYLADPTAWKAKELKRRQEEQAKVKEAREKAEREKEADGADKADKAEKRGGKKRRRGDQKSAFSADKPLPTKTVFILRPSVAALAPIIILTSAFVMIWTLLWVARAPIKGATYPKRGTRAILFSPNGRIGREQFWFGWCVSMAFLIAVCASVIGIGMMLGPTFMIIAIIIDIAIAMLVGCALIPFLWAQFMIAAKRVHDLGHPAYFMFLPWVIMPVWFIIFLVIPLFTNVILMITGTEGLPMAIFGIAASIAGLTSICSHIGFLFWLGLGRPDMRENRYGPPPIPGETGPQYPDNTAPRTRPV